MPENMNFRQDITLFSKAKSGGAGRLRNWRSFTWLERRAWGHKFANS
jgi:hypothetical protein